MSIPFPEPHRFRHAAPRIGKWALLAAVSIPLALGGCKGVSMSDITSSIAAPDAALPQGDKALRHYTEEWGKRFASNSNDKAAAINYARGLRALTQYAQATAVLQTAAVKNPNDLDLLGAYGKALADAGRLAEAAQVLERAHTPERPNWSILSAQGSVADQMGDHAAAQSYYEAALKIVPGEPSVLSNLGLSYALSKRLPQAEETLRQAAQSPRADARVRQNLALVLSLEGKFTEAEQLGQRDLSPEQAAANVATIRRVIAQSNTWRQLQRLDAAPAAKAQARRTARTSDSSTTVARQAPVTPAADALAARNVDNQ